MALVQAMSGTLDSRARRKREPELTDSIQPMIPASETEETMPDQYMIHPSEATAQGFTYNSEPPEPERCTCPQAQEYWRQQEAARQAAENAEKRRKEQDRIQRRIEKLIRDSGIRGRFLNRTFERFEITGVNHKAYGAAKRYAESFPSCSRQRMRMAESASQPESAMACSFPARKEPVKPIWRHL